jgi:hypothetical protein
MEYNYEEKLNQIYERLDKKRGELVEALSHHIFEVKSAYYNGHYYKNEQGDYKITWYPIPVVSVSHICDIEINLNNISVSTKKKEQMLYNLIIPN